MQVTKVFWGRVPEDMVKLIGYTLNCAPVNSNFLMFLILSHNFLRGHFPKAFGSKIFGEKKQPSELRRTLTNWSLCLQPLDPVWFTDRKRFQETDPAAPLKWTHYFKDECGWALRDLSRLNWKSSRPTEDTCSPLSLGKDFLLDINYYLGSLFSFSCF